jgi:hypothetical protein
MVRTCLESMLLEIFIAPLSRFYNFNETFSKCDAKNGEETWND